MGKTFDEWFEEVNQHGALEDKVFKVGNFDCWFSYSGFEETLKEAWDASRQNMTARDI